MKSAYIMPCKKLTSVGYKPDPDNSSTSTANRPFYKVRSAVISPDGTSHCVIEPPDPAQAQVISWSFNCVATESINQNLQNELPFFNALGNLKGEAIQVTQQGNFAGVSVFGETMVDYWAILIKDAGGWKIIYKEPNTTSCPLMQQYGVPKSVYGQCE